MPAYKSIENQKLSSLFLLFTRSRSRRALFPFPSSFINRTIDMDDSQIFLKEDDVLSAPASALMYQCTFKVSEFMTIMQSKLLEQHLFSDGMDCEVLSAGKNWTKGKLRMRLEFYPIESEVTEQKALPASPETSDTTQTYDQNSSFPTDTNDEPTVGDSTQISDNYPLSGYPDSNPHSRGMWS